MGRYVVTGGAGFIGSALANELVGAGHDVTAIDDLSGGGSSPQKLDSRVRFVEAKTSAAPSIDTITETRPDALFHLAAQPSVPFSVEHPIETTENNVMESVKLLSACARHCGRIVFASSSSVYGDIKTEDLPAHEGMTKRPASPYALHKSFIEDYGRILSELHGIDFVSLRFFNVYGPGQDTRSSYPNVVPAWLDAVDKRQPLVVYGDGTQSRDMAYIDDVTAACQLAAQRVKGFDGDCYNVAGGKRVVLNDIVAFFEERLGATVEHRPARPGDVMHTGASLVRTETELGYAPGVGIIEGLEKTLAWWKTR